MSEVPASQRTAPLRPWQAYLFALATTAATLGLHLALNPKLGGTPTLVMFTLPVIFSAYMGGLGPGLLATALSCLSATYYLLPPIDSFRIANAQGRWEIFSLALAGVVISVVNEALHRTRRRDLSTSRELRASEANYRQLLASNIVGVAFWNLQGDIVDANDRYLKMFGYSRDDLHQRNLNCHKLTPPEHVAIGEKALGELVGNGSCAPFEKECIRKDGSRIAVLVGSAMLADQPGTGTSFVMDITERKRMEAELRGSRSELRSLATNLRTAREDEAIRISREIHDQLGQALTGLQMDVTAVRRALKEQRQLKKTGLMSKLETISQEIEKTLQTARRVATELRPALLDELGLIAAIEWQTREFEERSSIFCNLILPPHSVDLDAERGTAVFRIFQEVLTNIARHAHATEVSVTLRTDPEAFVLEVKDNGVGIEPGEQSLPGGHGLLGMQERALEAGIRVDVASRPGQGTRVKIEVPTGGGP